MWNVGTRRQLFVDERFIERSEGVRLRMNPPVQHPEPVLSPDRPWESHGIGAYNTAMLEADGRFRLWYDACVIGGLSRRGRPPPLLRRVRGRSRPGPGPTSD